jgi:catechol 2,3-dioxygenase-like lactoylglutathione lyase family enzyme
MRNFDVAFVGVFVDGPVAVAEALAHDFGLARRDAATANGASVPVLTVGHTAIAVFDRNRGFGSAMPGPVASGVGFLALAADNLDGLIEELDALGFPAHGGSAPGLDGAPLVWLDPAASVGVRLAITAPLAHASAQTAGQVERIDHLGIASSSTDAGLDAFCGSLGLALESRQTDAETVLAVESFTSDRYGIVQHARPPKVLGGLRVGFVTLGDFELEFLEQFGPQDEIEADASQAGTTKRDRGAIARFIAARGEGLHHVALKTRDIDAGLARVAAAGRRVIDRVGRPGSRRGRIGFFHPSSYGGLLVHLVERTDG